MAPMKDKKDAVAIAAWNRIVPGQGALIHKYIKEMLADAIGEAKKTFIEETFPSAPPYNYPPSLTDRVHDLASALRQMGPDIRPHDQTLLRSVQDWFRQNDSYSRKDGLHMYGGVFQAKEELPYPDDDAPEEPPTKLDLGNVDDPEDCVVIVLRLEHPDEFIAGGDWENLAKALEDYGDIHSSQFMGPRRVILT